MKNFNHSYQKLSKATALLLLLAFLIPSGLQAKQWVDFCTMEMNHHSDMMMADDHGCNTDEAPAPHDNEHSQDDCDFLGICACDIGHSSLSEFKWTIVSNDFNAVLSRQTDLIPFIISVERIDELQFHQLSQKSPPLWLMYDTFLM